MYLSVSDRNKLSLIIMNDTSYGNRNLSMTLDINSHLMWADFVIIGSKTWHI